MKKLLTVVLILAMTLSLCITSFAAEETYTLTIDQDSASHTYQVYQIFTGLLSTDENGDLVLANIEWGTGVTEEGKTAIGDAREKAATLVTDADAKAFAEEIAAYLTEPTEVTYQEGVGYTTELVAGYYLIRDLDDSLDNTYETYTDFILKVVGDVTAVPKDGTTTVIKKIDDENDSSDAEDAIEWQDSADHDIGDLMDFEIVATIAEDYAEYSEYYLAFHDVEEKGLTFQPDSVKVYVNSIDEANLVDASLYSVVTDCTDGCTFEIVFADLKQVSAVSGNSQLIVTYQSQLNEDAVIGSQGNVNKVYGEFSNNPHDEQGGRGKTEWDYVIAFTYKTIVNKVDTDGNALEGAAFTLEKFIVDAENGTETYKGFTGYWKAIATQEAEPTTVFTFEGLDDGEYRLVETEAPLHYNAIDPIYFTVTGEHTAEWTSLEQREQVLTGLKAVTADDEAVDGVVDLGTVDVAAGSVTTDVENKRGIELPETGGIGTTIIYCVGAALVIAAIVFLVTRKRMTAKNR